MKNENLVLELNALEKEFSYDFLIEDAINNAKEIVDCQELIIETNGTSNKCDKLDYILASCCGVLCGAVDIFLVGKPGESILSDCSDKWVSERIKEFAKIYGWKGKEEKSAVRFLEKKFKVPYDQNGIMETATMLLNLNPKNHHYKSLAHNPTLCGLVFSIIDQFNNTSHFVSDSGIEARLICIDKVDNHFELRGNDIPSKLFSAFINWLGHLISDSGGSSSSEGRGMGIPSPFLSWANDIIALKNTLCLKENEIDQKMYELAKQIYEKGNYDLRFDIAKSIPVIINELLVRSVYSVRRLYANVEELKNNRIAGEELWRRCEPFSNAEVNRMLMIAHGTFFALDLGDATLRAFIVGGGTFNVQEFIIRLNIVGMGRFAICIFDESKRFFSNKGIQKELDFLEKKKKIATDYVESLQILARNYDDSQLVLFIEDFKNNDHKTGFEKTIRLAEMRNVPENVILRSNEDIDVYFTKGKETNDKR